MRNTNFSLLKAYDDYLASVKAERLPEELEEEEALVDFKLINELYDKNPNIPGTSQTVGEFLSELVSDIKFSYVGDESPRKLKNWADKFLMFNTVMRPYTSRNIVSQYIDVNGVCENDKGGEDFFNLYTLINAIEDIPRYVAM